MNTVVYRELSSLCLDLGFSAKILYTVSNSIEKHYKTVEIPKHNGETRKLTVPDGLLKSIQKKINSRLLSIYDISPYATAYRLGGSTVKNAKPHIGQPKILKLDIKHFFDGIIYPVVKEKVFTKEQYSEQNRILLTMLCVYKDSVPQGAPTSPAISNIIMYDFDNTVGQWCHAKGIRYTRYCDDMTFSGDFDAKPVVDFVKTELKKLGLYLNYRKTVVAKSGQSQNITGIVVNKKLSVPAEYKKKIRQEMYYCNRFGVESHIAKTKSGITPQKYLSVLCGRINYVMSVEPDNLEMKEYLKQIEQYKKTAYY